MRVIGVCAASGFALASLSLHGCGDAATADVHANLTNETNLTAYTKATDVPEPPQAPAYYALEKGTCCCPEGEAVHSMEGCHMALHFVAEMLSFNVTQAEEVRWNGTSSKIPRGCSFKVWPGGHTGRGHWNRAEHGSKRHDMIPVCHNSSASPHAHTAHANSTNKTEIERLFVKFNGFSSHSVSPSVALCSGMLVSAIGLAVVFRRHSRSSQPTIEDATSLIAEEEQDA